MGQDKALVLLDGVPLGLRAARTLSLAGCAPVHLVGRQPALATLGLPLITEPGEPDADRHPLLGVAAALRAAGTGLALICPCDLVNLQAEQVARLLSLGEPCVAASGERLHPLLALLPATYADRALELALAGLGAHRLCAGLPRVDLPEEALLDANRPEELPPPRGLC